MSIPDEDWLALREQMVVVEDTLADIRRIHDIQRWSAENNVDARLINCWSDKRGSWSSWRIINEQERAVFLLRWA